MITFIITVRQIAEIFTCKIFPAKICLEHVESVYDNNGAFSGKGNCYFIMHCYYCTCGVTSSTPMTQKELLDPAMDTANTNLPSTSCINLTLCLGSTELDRVTSEPCYKGIIP